MLFQLGFDCIFTFEKSLSFYQFLREESGLQQEATCSVISALAPPPPPYWTSVSSKTTIKAMYNRQGCWGSIAVGGVATTSKDEGLFKDSRHTLTPRGGHRSTADTKVSTLCVQCRKNCQFFNSPFFFFASYFQTKYYRNTYLSFWKL